MPQLTYPDRMVVAFPGMKADLAEDYCRSYVNAEASAEMPFGICVAQGTAYNQAILPVDANSILAGVIVHSHDYVPTLELGTTGLKPKTSLSIMIQGTIYVLVEEAVAVNDTAYVRHTASGGNTQKGAWRKSADTATAIIVRGARFLTAASSGGLAVVQVDFNAYRAVAGLT